MKVFPKTNILDSQRKTTFKRSDATKERELRKLKYILLLSVCCLFVL